MTEHRSGTSRRKQLFFIAFTLGFPLFFFLLLEAGLWVIGFGRGPTGRGQTLFVASDATRTYLRMNPEVGRRFYPSNITLPGVTRDLFLADKPADAYRIVVQGASTVLGYPYFYGAAFPRMLERRLEATFPDRRIEVVNTAMVAVNSYTLLDFADEIAEVRPDAVLIYAGHNEYYGLMGVASSHRVADSRAVVRAWLWLRRWRTVQLVQAAIDRMRGQRAAGEAADPERAWSSWSDLVPYGSAQYERGLSQFRANLDALLDRYRRAGIPVFLATVVSNERDHRPFVSTPHPDVGPHMWNTAVRSALDAANAGDQARAVAVLRDVVERDSTNADAFFEAARVFDSAGHYTVARALYAGARDRDHLRFRAPGALNSIIREAGRREGVELVDVEAAFARESAVGLVGRDLISEHVHPRLEGSFLIADAFYEALRRTGEIGTWNAPVPKETARADLPYTAVDSVYGELVLGVLTSQWPFRPSEAVGRPLSAEPPRDSIVALAEARFRRELSWPAAMQALYDHYYTNGSPALARHVARSLAQEYPDLVTPLGMWGMAALRLGDLTDAIAVTRRAHETAPSSHTALMRGAALLAAGEQASALRYLSDAAAQAEPDEPGPRAALVAARGLPDLERAVTEQPRDIARLHELAEAYAALFQVERAVTLLEQVLAADSSHAQARVLHARLTGGPGE